MEKKKLILVSALRERKRQEELREQYGVPENVKVVEKKSTAAQILRVLVASGFTVVRCLATCVLLTLAAIGLATIIYPAMREAGIDTLCEVIAQLQAYF